MDWRSPRRRLGYTDDHKKENILSKEGEEFY